MYLFSPDISHGDFDHNDNIGRIGELLTSYYLEIYKVSCEAVRRQGCDLWCETRELGMLKCEVKSTTKAQHTKSSDKTRYNFFTRSYQKERSDFHAFVALDLGLVLFYPSCELPTGRTKNIGPSKFTEPNIKASLDYTFKVLEDIKKAA